VHGRTQGGRGGQLPPLADRFFSKKGQFLKKLVFLGKKWDFAPPPEFFFILPPLKSVLGTPSLKCMLLVKIPNFPLFGSGHIFFIFRILAIREIDFQDFRPSGNQIRDNDFRILTLVILEFGILTLSILVFQDFNSQNFD